MCAPGDMHKNAHSRMFIMAKNKTGGKPPQVGEWKNQLWGSSEEEGTTGLCINTDQSQESNFGGGGKKQVMEEYIELFIPLHEVQRQINSL